MQGLRGKRWLVALLWCLGSSMSQAQSVYQGQLANGLKVLVQTDRRAPVVVSQIWYRVGSADEEEVTGVAHALEHMMFKGTMNVGPGEFSKRIAALGGRENAFTSRDYTAYFQTVAAAALGEALRLEADRMQHLRLSADEFAREIRVIQEERRLRTDDKPHARVSEALFATGFAGAAYRHPIIGWMHDLQRMQVADARRWYQRWYHPANATLVVVGDVTPEQVMTLAQQNFGVIAAGSTFPAPLSATTPLSLTAPVVVKAPAALPYVVLAWSAPKLQAKANNQDVYALELLASILDGQPNARLPRVLVQTQHQAVSVGAGYDSLARGEAVFSLEMTLAPSLTLPQAKARLLAVVEEIAQQGVSAVELARVKRQAQANRIFQRDSLFYQAMQLGILDNVGLPPDTLKESLKGLEAVTATQVQAAARALLQRPAVEAWLEPL